MRMSPHDAARELFATGRLAESERAWREILAATPADPEALHMLGYILATTGHATEGLPLIDRSIEVEPRNAAMRSNRAAVLESLGRADEAVADLRRAIDLDGSLPAPYNLLGNIHLGRGRLDEALAAFRRASVADAALPDPHVGMALVALRRGDRKRTRTHLADALARDPRHAGANYNKALLHEEAGEDILAEQAYLRALEGDPGDWRSLNNLGVLLRRTGRETQARECFERGAALAPGNPELLNNLGIAFQREGRVEEAIDHFARAVQGRPGFASALVNWGNALQDDGRLDAAKARYEEALGADSAFAEARYGLAQVALRTQRFAEGWPLYEARFETRPPFALARSLPMPRLDAANVGAARCVAVWSEQGLGDQVLFSTLLPELESRSIEAVVEVDPRLVPAYRRAFPRMRFVAPSESASAFASCDHHIPMGSMPALFRTDAHAFAHQPKAMFTADAGRIEATRQALGPGRWVGIAWRSRQFGDREALALRKSIPLSLFGALAQAPVAGLVDLQYGGDDQRAAFEALHPGRLRRIAGLDAREDLEGVLAAITACERIVTSSNVLAHLAGALGKPTCLLQVAGRESFHYWVAGPEGRSLWYPSVEIVTGESWAAALAAAARRLA